MAVKKKKGTKKRKVIEFFKIGRKNKEKIVKKEGMESVEEEPSKKQIIDENKILIKFILVIGIIVLSFLALYFYVNSLGTFEYRGLDFEIIQEGEITFYHNSFLIKEGMKNINYNVYLRNDPRELERIPFEGEIYTMERFVIDNTDDFVCGGDGGISMINLQQVFDAFGSEFIKDPNAECDFFGRFGFLKIQESDKTSIEQTGPACYNLNVNNCEILKVTEKFMIETLVKRYGTG